MHRARGLPLVFLVSCLAAAASWAETYELQNGDKVTGEVIRQDDERVVLEHEVFGRIELPLSEIAPAGKLRPGLFGTPFLAGWTRTLKLGANGQRGNTQSADVTAALDLDFEDDTVSWDVDARYSFSTADRATSKNNALLDVDRRKDLYGRWFWFASGRWEWDQFRSWDHRLTLIPGVGYQLVDSERFSLRAGAGPALTREFGGTDRWLYEAMVALDAEWTLAEHHTIEVSNRFFQAVNEDSPYRNLTDARWKWQLREDPGLSLHVGLENEYESDPLPGEDRNDFKYFTSLGIDF